MPKLFLFDGSALVHRSFHAFSGRSMMTSRGQDVGMLFGFLTSLLSVIRKEKPDRLAICFDTAAPTFRHIQYEDYKAHRAPLDEGIKAQLPLLYDLIDLLHVPQLSLDGYEADDIMGTLAREGAEAGMEVYLVSGDKDFLQLVNDQVKVYRLPSGRTGDAAEVIDAAGVVEKFGVPPEHVIDVLGLMGDSVDNVPGVPGVGQKTAVALVERFGAIESVLSRAGEVDKPKLRESLITYADQARLSRELVIIDRNVPVGVRPDDLKFGPLNNDPARKRLVDLEFRLILSQIDALGGAGEPGGLFAQQVELVETPKTTLPRAYHLIKDAARLETLLERLNERRGSQLLVAIDTETTAIDPMRAELVGFSFSLRAGEGYYIAANAFEGVPDSFAAPPAPRLRPRVSRELAYILSRLAGFYADESIPKTGQNLKYDLLVLSCYDVPVDGVAFDTLLASFCLDPSARLHGIDQLTEMHLGWRKIPTSSLIGSGSKQITMAEAPVEKVAEYACEDADAALQLTTVLKPRVEKEGLGRLYYDQELPLMPVLLEMEKTGVALDTRLLMELSGEFATELERLVDDVHTLSGGPFNLNSTQQLADVLFNRLGLPPGRKTKLGYSTDTDELERLAPIHELPAKLLRFRHLSKLKSTYIDSLPQLIHPITRRVHTSFSQTIAATGRLSSTDPNLQNIPIRSEEGGRIRRAFVPGEPGWKLLSADYSQIELRIMAHLSGDEQMIAAFHSGWDIHRATAAWMNGITPDDVTSSQRRQAKEVNFGVLYGMGEFGLAQRLDIPRARAREFIEQYFQQFPRVREYIDRTIEGARKNEFVETMMGRRRPIPDINSKNFNVRSNAERMAINTPIQGSAADLIKVAMIEVAQRLKVDRFGARMLLQVHDELLFEAPEDELERLGEMLKQVMSGAFTLSVPLEVGVGWGDNWLDAH